MKLGLRNLGVLLGRGAELFFDLINAVCGGKRSVWMLLCTRRSMNLEHSPKNQDHKHNNVSWLCFSKNCCSGGLCITEVNFTLILQLLHTNLLSMLTKPGFSSIRAWRSSLFTFKAQSPFKSKSLQIFGFKLYSSTFAQQWQQKVALRESQNPWDWKRTLRLSS